MMTRASLLILASALTWTLAAAPAGAAVLDLAASTQISAPRLAVGDLDGDGVDELIAAGRVGPFVAVTESDAMRRAALEVSSLVRLPGGFRVERTVATYSLLNVVEDVGVGDLDGDGRDEIVVVGGGKVSVLALRQGRLEVEAEHALPGRLWRVGLADVDDDGRDEMAVAVTGVAADDGDPVASVVTLYDVATHLSELASLRVDAHIGDLCFGDFDGDGRRQLALELGREEVGGIVQLYDASRGALLEQLTQQLTASGERALGLTAQRVGTQHRLALATVRGQLLVARQRGLHLRVLGEQAMPVPSLPLRSIVSIRQADPVGAAELLTTGGQPAGFWRVTGVGH